jgi:hypothetical protein
MVERRKHLRVTIKSVADAAIDGQPEHFESFIGGISRGGLELYAKRPIEKGMRLQLLLDFLDKDGKPQREMVRGQVRWALLFDDNRLAGIQFDQVITEQNHPLLFAYLQHAERFYKP